MKGDVKLFDFGLSITINDSNYNESRDLKDNGIIIPDESSICGIMTDFLAFGIIVIQLLTGSDQKSHQ